MLNKLATLFSQTDKPLIKSRHRAGVAEHSATLVEKRARIDDFEILALVENQLADLDISNIFAQLTNSYTGERILSEDRAVLLPLSSTYRDYDSVKIKGAGYRGGLVDFETLHTSAYDLPYYDSEGNCTLDKARAFQRAWRGGMSYQQATNEYRMSRYATESGFNTYPPIGYGVLRKGGKSSWFCLLAANYLSYWKWNKPEYAAHLVKGVPKFAAQVQNELYSLGLHSLLHGVTCDGESLVRKDFHTSRFVDQSDSFMARVCYYFFDVNFELATFAHPYFATGIENWIEFAWETYIEELTGQTFHFSEIEKAKEILVRFKYADNMRLDERMGLIQSSDLLKLMAASRMTREDRILFG